MKLKSCLFLLMLCLMINIASSWDGTTFYHLYDNFESCSINTNIWTNNNVASAGVNVYEGLCNAAIIDDTDYVISIKTENVSLTDKTVISVDFYCATCSYSNPDWIQIYYLDNAEASQGSVYGGVHYASEWSYNIGGSGDVDTNIALNAGNCNIENTHKNYMFLLDPLNDVVSLVCNNSGTHTTIVNNASATNVQKLKFMVFGTEDLYIDYVQFWNYTTYGYAYSPTSSSSFPSLNVTIDTPSNLSGINIQTLNSHGHKIWINTTTNMTDSSCSINGTEFTKTASNFTFLNNTNLIDGDYHYLVNCSNLTESAINGTDIVVFRVDVTNPIIITESSFGSNLTKLVNNATLITQINFTDNIELWSVNVTLGNGTILFNKSNIGQNNYQLNLTYGIGDLGQNIATVEACDAHTKNKIKDIPFSTTGSCLTYRVDADWVSICPHIPTNFSDPSSVKRQDRYSFSFSKKSAAASNESFIVTSNKRIEIAKGRNFLGHLVIPDLGTDGYWIDFENADAISTHARKLSENQAEVTINGLKGSTFNFNSIGELNCVTNYYSFIVYGILNVSAIDAITGLNIAGFNLYVNGTLNGSTTSTSFLIKNLNAGPYRILLDNASYADGNANITMTSPLQSHVFTLTPANSFNISFYDEQTDTLITDENFTVDFIGSNGANYSFNSTNGYLYASGLDPTTYTIRYVANRTYNGRMRHYFFTLTNKTSNFLTLYAIQRANAENISIVVYNQVTLDLVEGLVIYLQRRFADNTYRTVAMYSSDIQGVAYFEVEMETEYYKILADYPFGTLRKTTESFYINSATLNLYVLLTAQAGEQFLKEGSITYSLTFNNATNQIAASWTDPELSATNFCLSLKSYGPYGTEILNISCSTAASGSITMDAMNETQTVFGVFEVEIDDELRDLKSVWKEYQPDKLASGSDGLLLSGLMVMLFGLLSWLSIIALLLGVVALAVVKMIGILTLSWFYVGGIIAVGLIVGIVINIKKQ